MYSVTLNKVSEYEILAINNKKFTVKNLDTGSISYPNQIELDTYFFKDPEYARLNGLKDKFIKLQKIVAEHKRKAVKAQDELDSFVEKYKYKELVEKHAEKFI